MSKGIRKCNPRYTEPGVIDSDVSYSDERGLLFFISIKYDSGSHQGFGGILFSSKKEMENAVHNILEVLNLDKPSDLKGTRVECIFNLGTYNELIKGIRLPKSKEAFIWDAWREDNGYPRYDTVKSKTKSIMDNISFFERRIKEEEIKLTNLKKTFDEIY